jgi:3-carboxy-cis,cis-muconate cycloisomerase
VSRIFAGLFARGEVAARTSDQAFVQAMLDAEVALASALARNGLAPVDAVEQLVTVADAASYDLTELGRGSAVAATPVPALLRMLRERLGACAAAEYVHRGATSQDIIDTASMLVARRALASVLDDLGTAAEHCAELADTHRLRLQPGRTLLQQASPVTVGLKAANWLSGLDAAHAGLLEIWQHELAVQLGGAVGTLAALGERGLAVMADMARELELAPPQLPWHTVRIRPARLACALGMTLGVMGKVARDVILLAQSEVAELSEHAEPGSGGSSAIPHKRNPVDAVAVVACATRAPGLVATMLGSMAQEHERGAGGWQAEWEPQLELLRLAGSAAASLRAALARLEVHPDKLERNLAGTGGLVMSESVTALLAQSLGRERARELVEIASQTAIDQGRTLREALLALDAPGARIDPDALEEALTPERHLGITGVLIDRALAAHRELARGG